MHRQDSPLPLAARPTCGPIWRTERRDGPWALDPLRDPAPSADPPATGSAAGVAPLAGVERRLVRRAARLWDELRGNAPLPGRQALQHFLASTFAPSALLLEPPVGRDGACEIRMIGSRLDSLALFAPGPVAPAEGAGASAAGRLAALARVARAQAAPATLEIDAPGEALEPRGPGVLLRVVALPFAVGPDARQAVLVIASWRHLLSPEETAALHDELRSAVRALRRIGD